MENIKISLVFITLCSINSSFASAYTPKLMPLGQSKNGKYFIDANSVKTIESNKKQAVVYEKFSMPVTFDRDEAYQSDIKYHVFDCKNSSIAVYKGDYYKGLTSNSDWIGAFNYARSINGDTGELKYSYSNLEYYTIFELRKMGVGDSNITPYFLEAFDIICNKK